MTVREIIVAAIDASGADGLIHIKTGCSCGGEGLFLGGDDCPVPECELAFSCLCGACFDTGETVPCSAARRQAGAAL